MEKSEEKRLKMFEGIIPKEYSDDCIDCMDATVISQQDRTKDLEDKQAV